MARRRFAKKSTKNYSDAVPGSHAPRRTRMYERGPAVRWINAVGKECRTRRRALPKVAGGFGPGPADYLPYRVTR